MQTGEPPLTLLLWATWKQPAGWRVSAIPEQTGLALQTILPDVSLSPWTMDGTTNHHTLTPGNTDTMPPPSLISCAIHPSAHLPASTSETAASAPFPRPHEPAQRPLPFPQLPCLTPSLCLCLCLTLILLRWFTFHKAARRFLRTQKEMRACLSLRRTLQGSHTAPAPGLGSLPRSNPIPLLSPPPHYPVSPRPSGSSPTASSGHQAAQPGHVP